MNLAELEITNSCDPITEVDIVRFESDYAISLPSDYRNFLLRHNGGSPKSDCVFPLHENPRDTKAILARFFSLTSGEFAFLGLEYEFIEAGERFPAEILPIAYDPGGNKLGMVVKGAEVGKIYFWDLDDEPIDEELPTYEKLYFVANSFSELIESLSFWSGDEEK